jgi:hypothetical protein
VPIRRKAEQEQRAQERAELPALIEAGEEPDADTQRAIEGVARSIPAHALTALVQDVATNDGTISLDSVVKVGQRAGMTNEQAQATTVKLYEGYQRQANRAAMNAGVPEQLLPDLWRWAGENMKNEQSNAALSIALASDTAPIKNIVKAYIAYHRDQRRNRG